METVFVKESLNVQKMLALKVSSALKKDVFVYDLKNHFDNCDTKIIDNIRYQENNVSKNIAVLSVSAQKSFKNSAEYLNFTDKVDYYLNDIGVFIKYDE
nr:MAG: hypothetical protein DiTV3a_F4ORF11 [Diabrotica toursvirus 3a]